LPLVNSYLIIGRWGVVNATGHRMHNLEKLEPYSLCAILDKMDIKELSQIPGPFGKHIFRELENFCKRYNNLAIYKDSVFKWEFYDNRIVVAYLNSPYKHGGLV